jgi:hypothetical protein
MHEHTVQTTKHAAKRRRGSCHRIQSHITSHAGHADAADDGRGHGGGGARPGVEEVVQLGQERGEQGEGGAGGEDSPPQHGAPGRGVAEQRDVLGVVGVPDRPRQQAQLRDHERHPALRCAQITHES